MLDDERRDRLRAAGDRFRTAEDERRAAVRELKVALAAIDGESDPSEIAKLTGLPPTIAAILLSDAEQQ